MQLYEIIQDVGDGKKNIRTVIGFVQVLFNIHLSHKLQVYFACKIRKLTLDTFSKCMLQ